MRILIKSALGLGLALLCVSPALAQQGGGGGGGGGPANLLANTGVQKELKLDDKQIEDAKKLAADMRAKGQEARQSAQGLQGDERTKKMQEVGKQMTDEGNKGVAGILKADQAKRFKEIQLQRRGAQAFGEPEIQTALKLDDSQKEKIKALQSETTAKMAEIRQNNQDQAERTKLSTAARDEASKKMSAVLTESQQTAWKAMLGSPFEYKADPRPAGN